MNQNIFQDVKYIANAPLSGHTTFRIGGPAKFIFMPKNKFLILRKRKT